MKRSNKKLQFASQTIRQLDSKSLVHAAGGYTEYKNYAYPQPIGQEFGIPKQPYGGGGYEVPRPTQTGNIQCTSMSEPGTSC